MAQQAFGAMSAVQIQEGLKAKDFSAAEVARGALDGIAAADGQVHSFLQVTEDLALEAAARVDDALAAGTFDELGPLAGVPVGFKDNMNLVGTRTTCSSRMLAGYVKILCKAWVKNKEY